MIKEPGTVKNRSHIARLRTQATRAASQRFLCASVFQRCFYFRERGLGIHEVAHRAVSDERQKRQQTIRQFIDEWEKAKVPAHQLP